MGGFLVLGAWCLVLGAWFLVLGSWCLVLGASLTTKLHLDWHPRLAPAVPIGTIKRQPTGSDAHSVGSECA